MREGVAGWSASGAPALFGGRRRRAGSPVGTAQLATPDPASFHRLLGLDGVVGARDCIGELEAKMAAFHGVAHVVPLANASFGLLAALDVTTRGRPGALAMPSFSYRGLPYLARMLQRDIVFVDVLPSDGTLDPAALEDALAERAVAAVLAVHNVDRPARVQRLTEVCAARGVPLVFDSIYSLYNEVGGRRCGGDGSCEVFSLHATKLLNGFEGGYITTDDPALAARLRQWATGAEGVSLRCPLPSVHAAAALASLAGLDAVVAGNRARHEAYRTALAGLEHLGLWEADGAVCAPAARNFGSVLIEVLDGAPLTRDEIVALLCAEGYLARPYYGPALHQAAAWRPFARAPLPVTERLATRVLQLPVGNPLAVAECPEIVALIRSFFDDAMRIRAAFAQRTSER